MFDDLVFYYLLSFQLPLGTPSIPSFTLVQAAFSSSKASKLRGYQSIKPPINHRDLVKGIDYLGQQGWQE